MIEKESGVERVSLYVYNERPADLLSMRANERICID